MEMKKLLKKFLAASVAASFALNSAMGAVAAEGKDTAQSGLDTVIESATVLEDVDASQEETAASEEETTAPVQTEETAASTEAEETVASAQTEETTASTEATQAEDASSEEAKKEMGYVQFEGLDAYTNVELGTTVNLMEEFHGNVPEGQEFAGWTLNGGTTVYAPGSEFTFTKDLAADLGTDEDGVHGYLFSFKASFVEEHKEVYYVQFEGIDAYTEVELGTTVELMSNFHGKVEEGQKFAGWTLDGETVYAPGSEFTFTKDLAADLGTDEDGAHGYLFSFKASFVEEHEEVYYVQFEGIDAYTEIELGTTVKLMSNFHGKVEEGQKFAGWTLDGETVYAPGSEFTFTKDLAADLGTNEDGVHGYLFSFKASFVDAEAPETEAPQTEAPQTEAPQTEAPQTEAPQTEEETETETDEEVKPAPGDDGKDENGKGDDSAKKADQTEAVKTGDNTMIMPYVISLLAAAAVFAVILLKRRKSVR